jgi:hypothetical protein
MELMEMIDILTNTTIVNGTGNSVTSCVCPVSVTFRRKGRMESADR